MLRRSKLVRLQGSREIDTMIFGGVPPKKSRWIAPAAFRIASESDLFDLFQHLEQGFARSHKKTLVFFTEATTLKRVATGPFLFSGHDIPLR